MIQGPARYSPLHHQDAAQARRIIVLDSMLRDGWITASKQAAPELNTSPCLRRRTLHRLPLFVDYVDRMSDQYEVQPAHDKIYTLSISICNGSQKMLCSTTGPAGSGYKGRAAKPQGAAGRARSETGNVLAMVRRA